MDVLIVLHLRLWKLEWSFKAISLLMSLTYYIALVSRLSENKNSYQCILFTTNNHFVVNLLKHLRSCQFTDHWLAPNLCHEPEKTTLQTGYYTFHWEPTTKAIYYAALSEKVLTSLGSCLFKKVIKKIICYTNKKGSEFKLMTKLYIFFKLFSTKIKILFIRSSPKKCCFESNPNLRFVCHHWTCKVIVLLCICQGSISTLALWTNQLIRELTTP